jgi:hypothetical protein
MFVEIQSAAWQQHNTRTWEQDLVDQRLRGMTYAVSTAVRRAPAVGMRQHVDKAVVSGAAMLVQCLNPV